jgi:hypothetical protein
MFIFLFVISLIISNVTVVALNNSGSGWLGLNFLSGKVRGRRRRLIGKREHSVSFCVT